VDIFCSFLAFCFRKRPSELWTVRAFQILIADLNLSDTPAVARLEAMRNQATIDPFIIVAAETGGVAATGAKTAASGQPGWLNQTDSR
jgi:hypothetical protein